MKHPKIPMDDGWNQRLRQGARTNFSGAPRYDERSSVSLQCGSLAELGHSGVQEQSPWSEGLGEANCKRIGVTSLTFIFFGSCDVIGHVTISSLHMPFPIDSPLELSHYF